jgi:hypothetical protein
VVDVGDGVERLGQLHVVDIPLLVFPKMARWWVRQSFKTNSPRGVLTRVARTSVRVRQ